MRDRRSDSNRPLRSLSASLCALSVLAVVCSASFAGAQGGTELGVLRATQTHLQWEPATGLMVDGPVDGILLGLELREALGGVLTPNGLTNGATETPSDQILFDVNIVPVDAVDVVFSALPPGGPAGVAIWTSGHAVELDSGGIWFGDVLSFDAGIAIAGEVIGSIVAVGGDVTLTTGGSVRGDVVVIGGVLRQEADTKIYGQVYAPAGHRRPRLIARRAGELDDRPYYWRPGVSYDRVDGLRAELQGSLQSSTAMTRVSLWTGYALASSTWQYQFEIRQRLLQSGALEATGAVFRKTDTEDRMTVGRNENTVFSLISGSDYRDYFGLDGGELGLVWKHRDVASLAVTYQNANYRWMEAETNLWHLFRRDRGFRENFSTLDNRTGLADALDDYSSTVRFVTTVAPVESGTHPIGFNGSLEVGFEVAGGALGGDYDYDRMSIHGTGWWNAGSGHRLLLRGFYGYGRRNLPPNKLFYAGGIGSLRGFPQKSLVGRESLTGSVEYQFTYWDNPLGDANIILFGDFGQLVMNGDFWDLSTVKSNIGVGLDFGEAIRLDVAKRLDRSTRDIRVSLRIARPR